MRLDKLTDSLSSEVGKLLVGNAKDCEVLRNFYFAFPNRTAMKGYRKKFNAVKAKYPEVGALEEKMVEIEAAAATLNAEADANKIRLQQRRERLAAVVKTDTGVDITAVRPLFEGLKEGLKENRTAYVSFSVERALQGLANDIKRLTNEKPLIYSSDHVNFGLNRKRDNLAEVIQFAQSAAKKARVESDARRRAEFDFDSFMAKLATKVAAQGGTTVVAATLGGVWHGQLKVTTDVNEQVWFTKTIVNRTKEYHYYNQWPTTLTSCTPLVTMAS